MKARNKGLSPVTEYIFAGCLFGFIFPLTASIIEVNRSNLAITFRHLLLAQQNNPLLWIIDSAIFVLGIAGYIAGSRQKKLEEQAKHLEQTVIKRSQEIIHQKLFFEALVQNNPLAIVTLDKEHRIISINPAFQKMFGYQQNEIIGKEIDPIIANTERQIEAKKITMGVLQGHSIHEVGKRRHKNGNLIDVEIFGQPIKVEDKLIGVLGLYRNITVEKRAQEALAASEERFRQMFTESPVALRVEDLSAIKQWMEEKEKIVEGDFCSYLKNNPNELKTILKMTRIINANDASLALFGAGDINGLQKNLHSLLSPESYPAAIDLLCAMREGKTPIESEIVYQIPIKEKIYTVAKLSIMPGHKNDWSRVLFSNMDITDRKLAENRLRFISLHDLMTSLYNRVYFEEELKRLEKGRIFPISILVIDMDNLKRINDQYGHLTGDLALKTLADILRNRFRGDDVIARIGGDEFAVLLPGIGERTSQIIVRRILDGIAAHNRLKIHDFDIGISIGCATIEKGESLHDGLKLADQRMYEEKQVKKSPQNVNMY